MQSAEIVRPCFTCRGLAPAMRTSGLRAPAWRDDGIGPELFLLRVAAEEQTLVSALRQYSLYYMVYNQLRGVRCRFRSAHTDTVSSDSVPEGGDNSRHDLVVSADFISVLAVSCPRGRPVELAEHVRSQPALVVFIALHFHSTQIYWRGERTP